MTEKTNSTDNADDGMRIETTVVDTCTLGCGDYKYIMSCGVEEVNISGTDDSIAYIDEQIKEAFPEYKTSVTKFDSLDIACLLISSGLPELIYSKLKAKFGDE